MNFLLLHIIIIDQYKLTNNSKILDVGAGKGYLLYEIKKILPDIVVKGYDISDYAIQNSKKEIKQYLEKKAAEDKYNFPDKFFDLVFSINTLHNLQLFDLKKAIGEIQRTGKQGYIAVESYRNEKELFNVQCWSLTCQSFFNTDEWQYIYSESQYEGDYEFIYFE